MYTRCHSAATIFQKSILLKDSKCNAIMHRQLHSESLVIFSKIENKLRPLKRCFSGVSKNKDSSTGTVNLDGIGCAPMKGALRKPVAIPKFPREMVQQQFDLSMNQQMRSRYVQSGKDFAIQESVCTDPFLNLPLSINNRTQFGKEGGSIAIVIDKSEIYNSASPNVDVTVHVTTIPKMSSVRIIDTLSGADLPNIYSVKYNCCQNNEELKKFENPKLGWNPTSVQRPYNAVDVLHSLPRRQQNAYGIPIRSASVINEAFPSSERKSLHLKRNRSMESFPRMRKMVLSNDLHQKQPNFRELPTKRNDQQNFPVYRGRSQSRGIPSGIISNRQRQLTIPQIMKPSLRSNHMQRNQQNVQLHRGRSENRPITSAILNNKRMQPNSQFYRGRSQSVPFRNASMVNEGFQSSNIKSLHSKRSRSMESFPRMRKMILSNDFDQIHSKFGKVPSTPNEKMQLNSPVHRGRSQSRPISLIELNTKQRQLAMLSSMEPNLLKNQREQSHPKLSFLKGRSQSSRNFVDQRGPATRRAIKPNLLTKPMEQNHSELPFHRERSQNNVIQSGIFNNKPKQLPLQRRIEPNSLNDQMRRSQLNPPVHRGQPASRSTHSDNLSNMQKQIAKPRPMKPKIFVKQLDQSQNSRVQRVSSQSVPISLDNFNSKRKQPTAPFQSKVPSINFNNKQKQISMHQPKEQNLLTNRIVQSQLNPAELRGRSQGSMTPSRNFYQNQQLLGVPRTMEPKLLLNQMEQSKQNLAGPRLRSRSKPVQLVNFNNNRNQLRASQTIKSDILTKPIDQRQPNLQFHRGTSEGVPTLSSNLNIKQKQPILPSTIGLKLPKNQMERIRQIQPNPPNQSQMIPSDKNKMVESQPNPAVRKGRSQSRIIPSRNFIQNQNQLDGPRTTASNLKNMHPSQTNIPSRIHFPQRYLMNFSNGSNGIDFNVRTPVQAQQLQNPVNRVLRPASLDFSNNRFWGDSKRDVMSAASTSGINQIKKSMNIASNVTSFSPSVVQLGRKRGLINELENRSKNKFPETRRGVPKMLTFSNENVSNLVMKERAQNASKRMTSGRHLLGSMPSLITPPQNVRPMRQRNIAPLSRSVGTSFIMTNQTRSVPQEQFLSQQQSFQFQKNGLKQLNALKQRSPTSPKRIGNSLVPRKRSSPQRNFLVKHLPQKQLLPPQVILKRRSALRPGINLYQHPQMRNSQQKHFLQQGSTRQPSTPKERITVLPRRFITPDVHRNVLSKQYFQVPSRLQNTTINMRTRRRSSIPVRENLSAQMIMPRNNFLLQPPSLNISRRIRPAVPFGTLFNSTQLANIPHSRLSRNSLVEPTKTKLTTQDQRIKRNEIRRMNLEKLQSCLPMRANNQPNKITRYIEPPKSLQTVGRPPIIASSRNALRVGENLKRFPEDLLKICQKPMLGPKLLTNRRDKYKRIIAKDATTRLNEISSNKNDILNGNPAVLFYAPGKLKLINTPMPRLNDEKGVIVKMLYVHLTDADARMLTSAQNGPYKLSEPTVAGKCGSGVIVDAGKKVENVKVGDRVSIIPVSCGKCSACQNNNVVMCKRVPTSEKFGILKRYHAHPAKFVTKLPNKVNLIDGAMIGDLSSAIRACKKSAVTAGDNVLVLDGGSLGLWTALAAKSMGATNVCLADTRSLVLEQAEKLGIDRLFLVDPNLPILSTSNIISEYLEGENPRIVFDCSGSPLSNEIAINTTKMGGIVVLMKNVGCNQPIILSDVIHRGVDILSSHHGNDDSDRAALQFLASGKVRLNGINTRFFDISNVDEAFRLLASETTSNILIQINSADEENNAKKNQRTL